MHPWNKAGEQDLILISGRRVEWASEWNGEWVVSAAKGFGKFGCGRSAGQGSGLDLDQEEGRISWRLAEVAGATNSGVRTEGRAVTPADQQASGRLTPAAVLCWQCRWMEEGEGAGDGERDLKWEGERKKEKNRTVGKEASVKTRWKGKIGIWKNK